jgi:hypothetical protein
MKKSNKYIFGLIDQEHRIDMEYLLESATNASIKIVETLPALVELIHQNIPHSIIICCGHKYPRAVEHLMNLRKYIEMDKVHVLVFFSLPQRKDMLTLLA